MKSLKHLKIYFPLVYAFMLLFGATAVNQALNKPIIILNKQNEAWNLDGKMIQHFHLGFKRLASSLLWISTILESDQEHYKSADLNSWMFLRFKTISDLEPRFYDNYLFGSTYLSIIKDDLAGATYIYEKGMAAYPDDFELLKNAAFHFHFEVGDLKKSFAIYSKLKTHPRTNPLMLSRLARLESQNGSLEIAFELLKSQYLKLLEQKSFLSDAVHEQMYALKAEIDLICLNSRKAECQKVDLDENPYFYNGKDFVAKKKWIPFRVNGKKSSR